jgi:glycosyltransferase involved in cell wall biosynthesis
MKSPSDGAFLLSFNGNCHWCNLRSMDTMSLCITTYNRPELTVKAFENVLTDDRLSEICLRDDGSAIANLAKLNNLIDALPVGKDKVVLNRNVANLGMSANKAAVVSDAANEWCILLDSDNVISRQYLDAIFRIAKPDPKCIYMPVEAFPNFNFKAFSGERIDASNEREMAKRPGFDVLMNTCNYVVHGEKYIEVFEYNADVRGSDTIWFNYLWLKAGYHFYVMPGMSYYHKVHDGSGWLMDSEHNLRVAAGIKERMLAL